MVLWAVTEPCGACPKSPFISPGEGEDGGGGRAGSGAVRPAGGVSGRGAGTRQGGPETAPGAS